MSFADAASLAQELAQNLRHGRAFLKDATGVDVLSDCVLVLVHPEGFELRLSAQVVMVSDSPSMCGVGLELRPFGAAVIAQLEAFDRGEREQPAEPSPALESAVDEPRASGEAPVEAASEEAPPPASVDLDPLDVPASDESEQDAQEAPGDDAEDDDLLVDEEDEGAERATPAGLQQQQARHERLRKLSQVEQQKMARGGDLGDRVMLERLFGKAVWEALLHNPKVTAPEVARIARKGTVSRPLLDFIIDNPSWVQAGAVRRALLGNPRVTGEAVMKLLKLTPKHELKAMTKGTAYASHVRDAARKLLKI